MGLRKRMEQERQIIITYLDNKRETDILRDSAIFWAKIEMKACVKAGKEAEASGKMARLKIEKSLQHWSAAHDGAGSKIF